ncbi:family 10 glycosylhydrolase [Rapidithrix thailandica]|uniref:Family 10 glycosylhydrolase n=1 Tax=Rapidithrix thailandica TaxID=413964 RepID=A0AAW9SIR6_9BACT
MLPKLLFVLYLLSSPFISYCQSPIAPKREFRAVWIATVNNIDWPSKKGLSPQKQQAEFIQLLDKHKRFGFNAVIVQVRAAADAFYSSKYEPWSEWLSGKQGRPTQPYYDPLEFMIREAHKRGMEFHAWINPFRAVTNVKSAHIHENHITKTRPQWFLKYGSLKFFNPGIPEVRDYLVKIVTDIAKRYDVDGIHFDDYFYPYPDLGSNMGDKRTFYKYRKGFKYIEDWRRDNVSQFIEAVHESVVAHKPFVKFGVSPFGVWRNRYNSAYGSNTNSGYTSYDHLYADIRLWLQNGWVDYVAPQLYQNTKHNKIPFREMVQWWSQNTFGKHLYIGHAAYRIYWSSDKSWYDKKEIPAQIQHSRKFDNKVHGSIFYSATSVLRNRGHFVDSLRKHYYQYPALLPTMPWKDNTPPPPPINPTFTFKNQMINIQWAAPTTEEKSDHIKSYLLYRFHKSDSINFENPAHILAILSPTQESYPIQQLQHFDEYNYYLSAIDRLNNESTPIEVQLPTEEIIAQLQLPFPKSVIEYFADFMIQKSKDLFKNKSGTASLKTTESNISEYGK